MFKIEPFDVKTRQPLPLPNGELNSKKGHFIEWRGVRAELSPLEALSSENIEECLEELKHYEKLFENLSDTFEIEETFFGQKLALPKNISVLFCLESLLLCHKYKNEKISLPVNIMGTIENLANLNFPKENEICLKVKIAKGTEEDEKKFLLSLPKSIKLRLDGNQKMHRPLPDYFHELNLDYLEEPFKEIESYQDMTLPFALDENVLKWKQIKNTQLKALVVKPSVQLSLSGTYKLAKEAAKKNIKLIVSSAYETPVGLNSLLILAHLINENFIPTEYGLNGLEWFLDIPHQLVSKDGVVSNF
jgi:o-succinylbenzoate synthase